MRKTGQPTKTDKKKSYRKLLILLVVFISGITAYQLAQGLGVRSDKSRFSEASQRQKLVFEQIVQKIGEPVQVANKNICYNTEQGPYDDGHLWCQVASAAYFSSAAEQDALKTNFAQIVDANDLQLIDQRASDLEFEGAKDLPCEIRVYSGKFAGEPAYYMPEIADVEQTVVVRCADRAKARHYPYID